MKLKSSNSRLRNTDCERGKGEFRGNSETMIASDHQYSLYNTVFNYPKVRRKVWRKDRWVIPLEKPPVVYTVLSPSPLRILRCFLQRCWVFLYARYAVTRLKFKPKPPRWIMYLSIQHGASFDCLASSSFPSFRLFGLYRRQHWRKEKEKGSSRLAWQNTRNILYSLFQGASRGATYLNFATRKWKFSLQIFTW